MEINHGTHLEEKQNYSEIQQKKFGKRSQEIFYRLPPFKKSKSETIVGAEV